MTPPAPLGREFGIVAIAWLTYAGYYLGRVNLATAIPGMRDELGLSAQAVGALAGGFFMSYAAGQLASGYLGDRVSPRRLVFGGMLLSAALNILFGFLGRPGPMLLVWVANGVFQATGWAPILRLLADWHEPEALRRIAGRFATSFVAGSALTLLLAGWLAGSYGWRWAFWLPGGLMALLAALWLAAVRDAPPETATGRDAPSRRRTGRGTAASHGGAGPLRALLVHWPLSLAAALGGFLLFGLVVWTPALLVDTLGLGVAAASRVAALLPLAGILGTLLTGRLVARSLAGREALAAALLLLLMAALALLFPAAARSPALGAALPVLLGAAAYSAASVLLTTLPLLLSRRGETAAVAAGVDFAFNIGASVGGVLIGLIVDRLGWSAVFVALALAAGLGGAVLAAAGGRLRATP